MAAVPKIWDILKKGVESAVGHGSPLVQGLFQAAFAGRSLALQQGRTSPLCDLIFKKMYVMLGGRLKLTISGGGPVSAEVQNFIRTAFKVNLVQGYGEIYIGIYGKELCSGSHLFHLPLFAPSHHHHHLFSYSLSLSSFRFD
jgi:hypothetical protein